MSSNWVPTGWVSLGPSGWGRQAAGSCVHVASTRGEHAQAEGTPAVRPRRVPWWGAGEGKGSGDARGGCGHKDEGRRRGASPGSWHAGPRTVHATEASPYRAARQQPKDIHTTAPGPMDMAPPRGEGAEAGSGEALSWGHPGSPQGPHERRQEGQSQRAWKMPCCWPWS